VFNPAQLIKIMQFLYRRHPEIRMGVELLIKPGRALASCSLFQEGAQGLPSALGWTSQRMAGTLRFLKQL
jgi:hypothetical protein